MLKMMRTHAKFFYFLFVIVILSFIFWGVGTDNDAYKKRVVAEIGKETVTEEEYWRAYENVRQQFRDMYKGRFDEDMEKKMKLKEAVLNSLIEERVLLTAAKESGVIVTDKELQDTIVSNPVFMRDGIFKKDVYFNTLQRMFRVTPEIFENSVRRQLMLLKMRRLIESAVDVNPLDLKDVSGDEKKINETRQALLIEKNNAAVRSYVESVKQKMKFKVNMDIIS